MVTELPFAASLFETMVVVDELSDAPELNRSLRAAILARRARDPGVRVSNIGGWQSDQQMLDWGGEAAARLNTRILALADRFTLDIKAGDTPRHKWLSQMWANVSPPGALNQMHTHPGVFWSAVYYVDDGYAASEHGAAGGELILVDPRMPTILMNMPNLRFRTPGGTAHEPQLTMRPKTGRIVMFPAWLSHGVAPYLGSVERISIAVNVLAVPLGTG